jgi:hypothetical protein
LLSLSIELVKTRGEQNVDNFSGNAMTTIGKLEGVVGRLSLVFHLIEQPHSSEVNADIVNRVEFISLLLKHRG